MIMTSSQHQISYFFTNISLKISLNTTIVSMQYICNQFTDRNCTINSIVIYLVNFKDLALHFLSLLRDIEKREIYVLFYIGITALETQYLAYSVRFS